MDLLNCPSCDFPIMKTFNFCPQCGKKFKEPPLSTTMSKQLGIYALSLLLPPLGLWPGIKYLLQKNNKAKIIGIVAILLTIASLIFEYFVMVELITNLLKTSAPQLDQLKQLGY